MSVLRISACLLFCAVIVHAYSDYYRPMSQRPKSQGRLHHGGASQKYAATILGPPPGLPKLNRFYRPRMRGPINGGSKSRGHGPRGGGANGNFVGGSLKGKVLAQIPVKSIHQLKFRDYPLKPGYSAKGLELENPQIVEVMAQSIPLSLIFHSSSSKINIKQLHQSEHAKQHGGPKQSYSVDQPHVLKHSVTKPIIQEIREVITPYRKVIQTVNPVQEQVFTEIATSHKAPQALLNAYQLEPVLYVSPEAIKSQAEYKSEPALGNVRVEGYHAQPQPLLVSQYSIEQQLPQHGALLDHQQQHLSGYEAVQPLQGQVGIPVEASVASVQPAVHGEITQIAALPQGLGHSEPLYNSEQHAPAHAPVALVADASLLETYMKYAQMSAEDLLLPVYQATHLPASYAPNYNTEHVQQMVEAVPVAEEHIQQTNQLSDHQEQQYNAAPVQQVAENKAYSS